MINRKLPIVALSLLIGLTVVFSIFMVFSIFTLQTVIVQTKEQKIEGLDKIKSTNIFFLNVEELKNHLRNKNPWIGEIDVNKHFPQDLFISVNKSPITAYIKSYANTFEVTKDGAIANRIDTQLTQNIPLVTADGLSIKKGDRLPADINNAIIFITTTTPPNIQIQESSIDLKSANAQIVLKNGTEIIVPLVKIDQTFPASLQTIVQRFRIEGKHVAKIDFRFEKPIITLEGK